MAQAEQLERQQAAARAPASGKAVEAAADDDEEADTTGLDAGDIELVMSQANCSKAKGKSQATERAIGGTSDRG